MQKITFTTLVVPGKNEPAVHLMAESLRSFGGSLAVSPILGLIPESLGFPTPAWQEKLAAKGIKLQTFECNPELLKFPFGAKIAAAAVVEASAKGQTELLCYLDQDTLILQEPDEFLLPKGKALGYRPVHHRLIGPAWEEPVNDFWALIYRECEVPEKHLFRMKTHVGEAIRPYFNAGMFIVRPERGLLAQWRDSFLRIYRQPELKAFYEKDSIYAIFIHQAIWTGVLLYALSPAEMVELSPKVNYPLHLHGDMPANLRPATINELVSVRYENIFAEPGWRDLPITEPITSWIEAHLMARESTGESA